MLSGRYRLDTALASGGMGTVWSAEDLLLGRPVAVKEVQLPAGLDDEARALLRERTLREARNAARLRHPGIVTIYDVVEQDGRPWIVMELVPSKSLAEVIKARGPLPLVRVASIGMRILDAMITAQAAGVQHRDIKPANVLLADDGRVVLTDFGIARHSGDATLTGTGLLVGSPDYLSPERARGRTTPGLAADLWSLGATLYDAVEGRRPFARNGALPTVAAVVMEEADPMRLAGPLRPVIEGLLVKDPERRLDAERTRRMLEAVLRGRPVPAADDSPTQRNTLVVGQAPNRTDVHVVGGTKAGRRGTRPAPPRGTAPPAAAAAGAAGAAAAARPEVRTPEPGVPATGAPGSAAAATSAPGTDTPRTDTPRTDTPRTDTPRIAAAATSAPGTDTPGTDAAATRVETRADAASTKADVAAAKAGAASGAAASGTTAAGTTGSGTRTIGTDPGTRSRRPLVLAALALLLVGGLAALLVPLALADDPGDQRAAPAPASSAAGSTAPAAATGTPAGTPATTTAAPPPATTTTTPAPRTTTPAPRPTAAGVPAGFTRHTDPRGRFTVVVPAGWTAQPESTWVDFEDPATSRYLRVDTSTSPKADPYQNWVDYEKTFSAGRAGYQKIGIRKVTDYRPEEGWTVADWEFRIGGTHVLNRNIRVSGAKAHALYWSSPQSLWGTPENTRIFDTAAATFTP